MKRKLIIVARDTLNTGGGHVIEKLVENFINKFDDIIIFSDYENLNISKYKNVKYITTWQGQKLFDWKPRNKFLKIIRHFLQIFIFSISTLKLKNERYKNYIILDSNNEGLVSDISLTHDVFLLTYIKDVKDNFKLYRIFNPVLIYKIIKEIIVLNKKSTKAIIAISNDTLKEINKICFRKNILKKVIGHGVDTKYFYPIKNKDEKISLRKKYNIPLNKFILLLSGHEYERKGLKYVIKALKLLPKDFILIVTGGGEISYYKKLSKELKVKDRVKFLGLVNSLRDFYCLSDLFVLPTSYEGWGLVATEAMACGLPVLICKVGGVKEYLKDGYNGLFIERDEKDIAEKIKHVYENKDLYEKLKKGALDTAKQYSWDKVADKYIEVIDKVSEIKQGIKN